MQSHPDPMPVPPMAPLHVAIIMDGNGRWATQRGWPRLVGHRKGAERVREIVAACPDLGVTHLTVYAFSTENWKRSTTEVLGLMKIFARYIKSEANKLAEVGVRLRFIGDRTRLDPNLQELMAGIEIRTAQGTPSPQPSPARREREFIRPHPCPLPLAGEGAKTPSAAQREMAVQIPSPRGRGIFKFPLPEGDAYSNSLSPRERVRVRVCVSIGQHPLPLAAAPAQAALA